ncbi:MAG TPA: potassium-transporting ATPase subunit KdpA [Verrucomicrobiae bacterium]|nr:potassium-transporting ATPase subunit KdpA [Verrucomicrobiae bacterium]
MKANEVIQLLLYFGLLVGLTPAIGGFMARVFEGRRTLLHPILGPVEKWAYRLGGVDMTEEMSWKRYLVALLAFNLVGFMSLWGLQMVQAWLPLNPQKFGNVKWDLAFNTAMSFTTNTNWQAYSGESVMSYLTQMIGLAVHNFTSAATGLAVLLAIIRGLRRASAKTIGNFWVDLTRSTLYVLMPLSLIVAIVLVSQGVVQNFEAYPDAKLVEPYTTQVPKTDDKGNPVKDDKGNPVMVDQRVETQSIPLGPAASQIAIKQLGTNGGGFYGQNSAHPFENPTPLSNLVEMLAILLLPASLVYMFGSMVRDNRHGWVLFGVMLVLLLGGFSVAWWAETRPNPVLGNVGQLLEGKETRFGVMNSVLWATATTCTSNGSVNSMHDSLSPLAGFVALANLMLGCIAFGGVGVGLTGLLMHVLIAVFIAGLMVGRTPEYLGKKIQQWEATWAVIAILVPCALILFGSAIACGLPAGLSSLNNQGPHGLSEIFYAYASAANNNGSAFAGLNANTVFYNLTLGVAMLLGRFVPIIAVLAIAGGLAAKKTMQGSAGTLPTNGLTFAVVLFGVIVIVAALTFFPALCLGPIVEHGLMLGGRVF